MLAFAREGAQDFHPLFGVLKIVPAELTVESMRVTRGESPAAQTLQVVVTHDCFDQPLAEAMRTVVFVDENVTEIGKDRVIADDPRQADLFLAIIQAEDQGIGESTFRAFAWTPQRPVGAPEEVTDGIQVEPGGVSADSEILFIDFKKLWHGASLSWVILSLHRAERRSEQSEDRRRSVRFI